MPKMKTKSGAKKRFSRTASGKIKFKPAHKRHRLISKPKQPGEVELTGFPFSPAERHAGASL